MGEGKLEVTGEVKELEEKLKVLVANVVIDCVIVLKDEMAVLQPGYAEEVVVGILV